MESIIICGIILAVLLVMCGIVIGGMLFIPEIVFTYSKKSCVLGIIGIIGTIISTIMFIGEVRNYYIKNAEFSLNKYSMNKKIMTTKDNNGVKTDTVIFFNLKSIK